MPKKYTYIFVLTCFIVLAACGNGAKDENKTKTNPVSRENKTNTQKGADKTGESPNLDNTSESSDQNTNAVTQSDMKRKMDQLEYTEFELEVEYANHQEYEAEIEKSGNNSLKAKIEDSLNNVEKKGADAFNELYPLVQKLTIMQQTSKGDAIQEILATFNLPTDYQMFNLELRFKDGTKLEFEDGRTATSAKTQP